MKYLINFFATYLIFIYIPVFVWIIHRKDKQLAFRTILAVLLALGMSTLIKDYFYLPRPFITGGYLPPIRYGLDGSLPSGHTAVSFAFSFSVLHRFRRLGLLLVTAGVFIALGRIIGGVHTIVDVSAGLVIALISYLISVRIFRH